MSRNKTIVGLAGAALVGLWGFARRGEWIARGLDLPPPRYTVAVERGLRIPMRDGITLAADHYAPRAAGAFPTILMRTPYGRSAGAGVLGALHLFASQRFAERGYHVIVQNTRGRFDSEGEFEPFVNERPDGLDTLDWIARQPWFNGRVGMWGQSYEGYVQWAVAADAPDSLQALVPSITGSQLTPYAGTAFSLDTILRWLYNLEQGGKPGQGWHDLLRLINPQAATRALAPAFRHLPAGAADASAVGHPVAYFRRWFEHPHGEAPFWLGLHYGKRMKEVRAAVHLVSGWYDFLLHQLLTDYAALVAAGHSPYLTIGPWRHLDVAGAMEALRAGILWADAVLKGDPRRLREKPVRLWVMSARGGGWREMERFPPPARETPFFLHARGQLSNAHPTADSPTDHYRYDPADPTPAVGGPLYHQEAGPHDNRGLEARADVLTYTTAPLAENLLIIGWVRLELYASSSLPYADFFGRLCDVYPDGRSINICDGLVRLVPGAGEAQPDGSPRQPDGSRYIDIDMWATAYRFLSGHRIRLQVSSGAFPRWDRNLGTGEPVGTGTDMRVADQTIYHDEAHPSALVLPVL